MRKVLLAMICVTILAVACGGITDYSKPDFVITASLPPQSEEYESTHKDSIWVFPASIQIGAVGAEQVFQHYVKGAKIIYPVVLHAGAEPLQFHLSYEGMDSSQISTTYVPAPAEAVKWVTFPEPDPLLAAYETREVPVHFFVPRNAVAPTRWEFLVRVDWEQPGFFRQARAILFQINMRA